MTTYCFKSADWIFTANVIRMARVAYKGKKKERTWAINVVCCGWDAPQSVCMHVLTCPDAEFNKMVDDEGNVTVTV
jgi:hypothetical protein